MAISKPDWVTEGVDTNRPNPARIYDYLLGGHHNFAADRAAAEKLIARLPRALEAAVALRAFLRRTISFFTAEGIDQFLDIGSGLPTEGNVHDLARAIIPGARVVYVDIDPVVVMHSSQMLKDDPGATIIEGDLRSPSSILEDEEVLKLLDFSRPLGVTMTSVIHFIVDDELAYGATQAIIDVLAPGSYVAISHGLVEDRTQSIVDDVVKDYKAAANVRARRRAEIARFFDGLDLVHPGLVRTPLWRPEGPDDLMLDDPTSSNALVGVGRKS
jgi:hypothetical protein